MSRKIIHYKDDLGDDFAGTNINQKKVTSSFRYVRDTNFLWKGIANFLYFLIAKPLVFVFDKLILMNSFKNKKVLKQAKGKGYFFYGNHSSILPDCFNPNLLKWRRNYIIVNPDATSIPGIQTIVMMFGAIPLGSDARSKINMYKCVEKRIQEKASVTIYPEAHIWPYYTKVRPYKDDSFYYPVRMNAPVFALSTCYSKHKGLLSFMKHPKVTVYVDGPFYPDQTLDRKEAMKKLRDEVYATQCERTKKYSTYCYYEYVKDEVTRVETIPHQKPVLYDPLKESMNEAIEELNSDSETQVSEKREERKI